MHDQTLFSRRTFLRGTGVALALPWLETFAVGGPTENETPRRFVSIYHPDGVGLPLKSDPAWHDWSWFPRGGETDFELTKVLDVLEPLRSEITIYSGLSHPHARNVHGHSNADQYLTGAPTRRTPSTPATSPGTRPWSCRPTAEWGDRGEPRPSRSIAKAGQFPR
jgi:hypothetical protein